MSEVVQISESGTCRRVSRVSARPVSGSCILPTTVGSCLTNWDNCCLERRVVERVRCGETCNGIVGESTLRSFKAGTLVAANGRTGDFVVAAIDLAGGGVGGLVARRRISATLANVLRTGGPKASGARSGASANA